MDNTTILVREPKAGNRQEKKEVVVRYCLYSRKSTESEERQVLSIDSQIKEMPSDMEKLKKLAITLDWAQKTHKKDSGKKIVYAPACFLDDEALEQYNIRFVSIPYNLFEKTA